jgi:metal-sulfur cluster biosynthetic enzyme
MFGTVVTGEPPVSRRMALFKGEPDRDQGFDDYDEFVPAHVPEPGPAISDHEVLTGEEHVQIHEIAREVFETRGVYDSTFGYNLAKLNLDHRHPDGGFRYAVIADGTLIAEFTPTTPFCPQSSVLTTAAHRAWNGEREAHDFESVEIRIDPMHQHSEAINEKLRTMGQE